ncbi:unnamed protein product [Penicillium viridicatum]
MAPGTRGTTAQPGQPSNRGKFRPNNEDDQDQDQFVEAGNLQPTEAQPTQADMQALQRELDKTKQELAALQALSVSIKKDPMPGPSSASKTNRLAGKAKQAINNEGRNLRQSEQTTFSMREQTIALPSAAEQEAAAIQYLSFVENMAKYGRSRAQFKFPSLTGMTNYRAWAQNVKLLLNQHRLVQIIEGQAGSLPPYHPNQRTDQWKPKVLEGSGAGKIMEISP